MPMESTGHDPRKEIVVGSAVPGLPFSAVVGFGDLLFVSGTIGHDPETHEIVPNDVAAQTTQALRNIEALLMRAGSSLDRVLKVTVFMIDIGRFQEMNRAYRELFRNAPPARSTVGVASLPDAEAQVECEVIAVR